MKPAVVQHADSSIMLNISGEGIESEIEEREVFAAEILHPPRLALITDT